MVILIHKCFCQCCTSEGFDRFDEEKTWALLTLLAPFRPNSLARYLVYRQRLCVCICTTLNIKCLLNLGEFPL